MSIKVIESEKYVIVNNTAMLTKDASISVREGDTDDRRISHKIRDVVSTKKDEYNTVSFVVDNCGSGTPTTPPAVGALIKACGGKEEITDTSVKYTRANPNEIEPVSAKVVYCEAIDGKDYVFSVDNATGQIGLSASSGGTVDIKVQALTGDYNTPAAVDTTSPDFSALADNLAPYFNSEGTPIFSFDNRMFCADSFEISNLWYGAPERINMAGGCKSTSLDGTVLIEASFTVLEKDWDADYNVYDNLDEIVPFEMQAGTEAGKIMRVTSNRMQIMDAQPTAVGKFLGKNVTVRFLDDIEMEFK